MPNVYSIRVFLIEYTFASNKNGGLYSPPFLYMFWYVVVIL